MIGTKFEIVSYVTDVSYTNEAFLKCKIALSNGNAENSIGANSYHRSEADNICKFAERCKHYGLTVKVTGEKFIDEYSIVGIEFANVPTNSDNGFYAGFNAGFNLGSNGGVNGAPNGAFQNGFQFSFGRRF